MLHQGLLFIRWSSLSSHDGDRQPVRCDVGLLVSKYPTLWPTGVTHHSTKGTRRDLARIRCTARSICLSSGAAPVRYAPVGKVAPLHSFAPSPSFGLAVSLLEAASHHSCTGLTSLQQIFVRENYPKSPYRSKSSPSIGDHTSERSSSSVFALLARGDVGALVAVRWWSSVLRTM